MRNWLRPSVLTTWTTWNKILGPPVAFQAQDCDNLLVVFSSWIFLLPNRTSIFFQVVFLFAVDVYGAVTSKGALLCFLLRPPFRHYNPFHSPRIINLMPNAPAYVAFLILMSGVTYVISMNILMLMLVLMFMLMLTSQVWTSLFKNQGEGTKCPHCLIFLIPQNVEDI